MVQINGNGNVYEQIVEHYRKYISLGVIASGEKMPSCRELAIQIGVNHKTVERAYGELVLEGLVISIPKKGYFVAGERPQNTSKIREVLQMLKDSGVGREEIIDVMNDIYGGVINDRS